MKFGVQHSVLLNESLLAYAFISVGNEARGDMSLVEDEDVTMFSISVFVCDCVRVVVVADAVVHSS